MAYSDKILERSIDPTVHQMLDRAEQLGLETVWDRYEKMLPECGFGELGVCCRNCNMGPCRISPFEDEGPQRAICGATADIIVARNLIRMIAGGAAPIPTMAETWPTRC
jgi:carbon-monoxide dehydrogenase catalytic subunit